MSDTSKPANRLIDETSPYLLQHAYNPVDWWPWCDEAFERAKIEDKPVLVSIGYSACHWCHVMEHESFEDESVAAIMNEHFINIKVDMEERPDVDQIYMSFVQMTTGRGGWPMNVFITPDKKPFFGGTYFPPQPRYGMPSWSQILLSLAEAYRERRDEVEESAANMVGELRRISMAEPGRGALTHDLLERAFQRIAASFDRVNGGFGGAPKFPQAMTLEFLLRYHHRTGDPIALEMVTTTLDKMAAGGIYDQIGGGFHRYAVDAIWLVPHFEKMLYDNAQLARVYLHAFQVTKNEQYRTVTLEILEYVKREMLDASGAFYSTQDADSEGEEGKFFVWSVEEIEAILGADDARVFCFYYDVTRDGNFEGHNILNRRYTIDAAAAALKMDSVQLIESLARSSAMLFDHRENRIKPHRDEKTLTAWNALMAAAFSDVGSALGIKEYIEIARQNCDFLVTEMRVDGRLCRTWKEGRAKLNAYLDDHSYLADALLEVHRATGDIKYFVEAKEIVDGMIVDFWDEESGGFYFTATDHEQLVVRNKDVYDNATPSGNSVAADVLVKLARLTGEDRYEKFAVATLRLIVDMISRSPTGFGRALSTAEAHLSPRREIVLVGNDDGMRSEIAGRYLPTVTFVSSDDASNAAETINLFAGRATDGTARVYICEDNVCQRPVATVADLQIELKGFGTH